MYSYLNAGRGIIQVEEILENHQKYSIGPSPISYTIKFKLAVYTVPTKALACSMACEPCQPIKFKGY